MLKNDKLLLGIVAGLVGSSIKDILTIVPEILSLRPTYWDYGEYLLFHSVNKSVATQVCGVGMEILFGVILAVVFIHIKHLLQTNHPLLRGAVFGLFVWFAARSLITLTHITFLRTTNPIILAFNIPIAVTYGLSVAYIIDRIERK